jgi:hypothetical protein
MSIRPEQRNTALAMLQRLVYSKTLDEYDRHLQHLADSEMTLVYEYIMRNWHGIRAEWVVGLTQETLTLSQKTTNRLESLNKHVKAVVSKFAALPVSFDQFFVFLDSWQDERNYCAARMLDVPVVCLDPVERLWRQHLTPYAWEMMSSHFMQSQELEVTIEDSRYQVCCFVGILSDIDINLSLFR